VLERLCFANTDGFVVFAKPFSQMLCFQKSLPDIFVEGIFIKENHAFATGTLARIAILQPPGFVAKIRFASRTTNLN